MSWSPISSHRIAELTSDALAWPGPMRAVWHGTASLRMAAQSSTEIYAAVYAALCQKLAPAQWAARLTWFHDFTNEYELSIST